MNDWGYYLFFLCVSAFFIWMALRDIRTIRRRERKAWEAEDEAAQKLEREYRMSPGSELRFKTQQEEDDYYQQLWDKHGGTKIHMD